MARDIEYSKAVLDASHRIERTGKLKAIAGGVLLAIMLGAFVFTWLTVPNASGVAMFVYGPLISGATVWFLILPGLRQGEKLREFLEVEPMSWFSSPSDGLVVITNDGVFLERGLTRLPFDAFAAESIRGAAYLEESHRLRLQLLLRTKNVKTQEVNENPSTRDVRLSDALSPDRALELALKMNARAHELRH